MNIDKLLDSTNIDDIAIGVSIFYERYGKSKTLAEFHGKPSRFTFKETNVVRGMMYFNDCMVYCGFENFSAALLNNNSYINKSQDYCKVFDFRTKKNE